MKPFYYTLGVISLILIQTTLLEHFSIAGTKPDLALLAVYFVGLLAGEGPGVMTGLALGYLTDLMSGGVWGTHLASKALLGFLAGFLGRTLLNVKAIFTGVIIALCSIFQGLILLTVWTLTGELPSFTASLTHTILLQALYDGALGMIVFLVLSRRTQRRETPTESWLTHELFSLSSGRDQRNPK